MRPDYKNWLPKGMIWAAVGITAALLALLAVFALTGIVSGALKTVLCIVLLVGTVFGLCVSLWVIVLHRAFSYDGKRQLSRQVVEGIASRVELPEGGTCLDVGCGSGALTIACAKRNPGAKVVGVDRWGKEYASYNKPLCERNAEAEGVRNVTFDSGNATHLAFPDESFDAVVSNYVYHNIPGERQKYLLETLRVLKKGGVFALHDIFSAFKYGDMRAFVRTLKNMGYADVRLIDTTDGTFMARREAFWLGLSGSALLIGRK